MFRFSLAALFLFLLVAALGSAALANPTEIWQQAIVTLTVAILMFAALAAAVCQRQRRTFAIGFAVAGWLYFTLAFVDALKLRDDLLTETAIEWSWKALHEDDASPVMEVTFSPDGQLLLAKAKDATLRLWQASGNYLAGTGPTAARFGDVGHALWTLLLATAGGAAALWLAERRDAPKNSCSSG